MNWRRARRLLLAATTVSIAVFSFAAWFVGGALLAPAQRPVSLPPHNLPIVSTTIQSSSGSNLAAWHMPNKVAQATVVLLHPIRADRRSMLTRAKLFYEAGFSVLLVDLQAHGESGGSHITAGYLESRDARAAVEFAQQANPQHRIGVVGWSLGGAAALLGSPMDIDAIVLEAVYPTISEAIHNRISMRLGALSHILAPALLVQLKPRMGISISELRPIDCIDDVGCPVLVAAGSLDQHTPLAETQRLFSAANEPKKLVIFGGAVHGDLLAFDSELYTAEILGFMNQHLMSFRINDSLRP